MSWNAIVIDNTIARSVVDTGTEPDDGSALIAVSDEFGCDQERIITQGRKNNIAREVAIFFARKISGKTCKDLGEFFGGVSGALITMKHDRVAKQAEQNRWITRRIAKIEKRIFNI